jgi:phosphate transport system substrate-binding protein
LNCPTIDPADLSGEVITAGSSTVFPLAERIAQRFEDEGFGGNITIDSIGSGAGFERFCVAGESDISNASRAIRTVKSSPAAPSAAIRSSSALAPMPSPSLSPAENDFVTDVTLEQLALIFSTAETWADVDPSWPAEPILRFIPGTDSGTFDYFVEVIFEEDEAPILNAANIQFSEDDNVLVQGVQGSPYAIGFFGYAYYNENARTPSMLPLSTASSQPKKPPNPTPTPSPARSSSTPMPPLCRKNPRSPASSTSSSPTSTRKSSMSATSPPAQKPWIPPKELARCASLLSRHARRT